MPGPMVRTAETYDQVRIMVAVLRAQADVVKVNKRRAPTPGHHALAVVASDHLTPCGRRDGLRCPLQLGRGRVADVLGIAFGHLQDVGADIDELTATLLLPASALGALGDRDLIPGSAFVFRAIFWAI